jgi:hypothetical protein
VRATDCVKCAVVTRLAGLSVSNASADAITNTCDPSLSLMCFVRIDVVWMRSIADDDAHCDINNNTADCAHVPARTNACESLCLRVHASAHTVHVYAQSKQSTQTHTTLAAVKSADSGGIDGADVRI